MHAQEPQNCAKNLSETYAPHSWQASLLPLPGQSIDMHGDMATHTLLDSVVGGQLFVSGGKEAVFPNHALELTVWNFRHRCAGGQGGGEAD